MSELTTIARPYAKAAFDYAVENSAVDAWQTMLVFAGHVAENDAMQEFLNGATSADKTAEVFIQVCGDELNEHGQNFVKVMAESGRLTTMMAVAEVFAELRAEHEKQVDVEVRSAAKLSAAQKKALSAQLETRLARKVKLNCSVDPELIAGMVVKAGDTVIDSSVRGKLNRLSETLQS